MCVNNFGEFLFKTDVKYQFCQDYAFKIVDTYLICEPYSTCVYSLVIRTLYRLEKSDIVP